MEYGTDPAEGDAYSGSSALTEFRTQGAQERLDLGPLDVGGCRLVEYAAKEPAVLRRQVHGVSIRHYPRGVQGPPGSQLTLAFSGEAAAAAAGRHAAD